MRAETGMVISQASRIFFVIVQLTDFGVLLAPTPMTEEVTTCVALMGSPVTLASITTKIVDSCEEKEFCMSILQISMPTVLIILYPPVMVPMARAQEAETMSQRGITTSV